MTPLKLFRKAGQLLRGGVSGYQILLAAVLGYLLGFTIGFNMASVAIILLLVLLNANLFVAMVCAMLGKLCSLLLAPVTFRLGYATIHDMGFEGVFRTLGDTPVVAWMNTHNYCQTGGMLVGIVLGLVTWLMLTTMLTGARTRLAAARDKEGKFKKVSDNGFVRFVLRVLFGKAQDLEGKRGPMLRKGGVILVVLLVGLIAVGEYMLSGPMLGEAFEDAMGQAIGAEVNVEKANLSLTDGSLRIEGLQVTDPKNPANNLVAAKTLVGNLSITDLLARRFVMDRIEISDVQVDSPRKTPGEVYPSEEEPEEVPDDFLFDYFEKAKEYRKYLDYLKKAQEWLKNNEDEVADEDREPTLDERLAYARRHGYASLDAQAILSQHPTWVVRELVIEGIRVPGRDDVLRIDGANLSDYPSRDGKTMAMKLTSDKDARGVIALRYEKPGQRNGIELILPNVPIAGLLGGKSPVEATDGMATIKILNGMFNSKELDIPVVIETRGLKLSTRGDKSVLGLDNSVFEKIKDLPLAVRIVGTPSMPRLSIDDEQVKAVLLEAAKGVAMDMLIDQLGKQDPRLGQLGELLKGNGESGGGLGGLGDLFKGDKKPAEATPGKTPGKTPGITPDEKKKNPLGDLLKGF